jgi:hypothetical protein
LADKDKALNIRKYGEKIEFPTWYI